MAPDFIEEYLKTRYREQVDWYDRKAAGNRWWFVRFQWTTIVLAAVTPALLANQSPLQLKLAAVTSLTVAILAAGLKAFRFEENWLSYRSVCEALKTEYYLYRAGIGDYSNPLVKDTLFVERAEAILSRENAAWLSSLRSNQSSNTTAPAPGPTPAVAGPASMTAGSGPAASITPIVVGGSDAGSRAADGTAGS